MARMKTKMLFAAMLCLAAGCQPKSSREPLHRVEVIRSSSGQLSESLVGRKCRVQLRRDALGLAGNTIPEMTGRWSALSSVEGMILEISDDWLIVQATTKRVVVPHSSILFIELQD
ncbi:MAG: hypothetical protein QOF78_3667 [Phycisphaerales bacterium]|jgi:hypothetical protein|nr:hypothetical protein [Phycisphaerales bacterium]